MPIVRYQPKDLFDQLHKEFFNVSPWFKEADKSLVETSDWIPRVDIQEDANQFTVLADIPGVDPKDIQISMDDNVLTVKGERKSETEEKGKNFTRVERSYGTFYRQFTLPDTADGEKIRAKSKHGVLELVIPRIEKSKKRSIEIKVED